MPLPSHAGFWVWSCFSSELTGIQNAYLYGAYFGRDSHFIDNALEKVLDFAELGDFVNQPMRTYSTGMKTRLGFSLALAMKPEVLILDEAFAAGDRHFRSRSEELLEDAMSGCRGVILVSHNSDLIDRLAHRVLEIDSIQCVDLDQPKCAETVENSCKSRF